ncbi:MULTISPECIES: sensor histidine kinase [unclassified Rhizobium]|uniref:sensor histidine kinase n=1 Tax=unclassified Rhizobium TaxID=2613769 RepID=UPI0017915E2C|nr:MULTISPECIES: sensor histidine kinase [unclassified Rhizobium]MBB3385145.1 two-component system C4-dicarboxylate transport sensor histidine kinase DctB [Rhizobium sp. BK098]MBB3617005.1 two-component system C4-dicarboxylate transport sensor histidine kinase DctB [Rhizobium sp. BK609]MBB3682662.1 two-component system C4-dicarboxylate transport sensor histidine kinase DctB [Rhizobium sp. BK612]
MHNTAMLQRPANERFLTPEQLGRRSRRVWLVFAFLSAAVIAAGLYGANFYGRLSAIETLQRQGHTDANLKVALLRAVLERPRALPLLLADDQQVRDALAEKHIDDVVALDRKLESLVSGTSASVLYVTGKDGVAMASSNWREPLSFVGNDYSFRDYFRKAMETGTAEHYALGTVSNRPGLYISRRVGDVGSALGVVVVKMEFDQLEADWSETGRPAYVTDERGVVLITSLPSWRFMTTAPLAREEADAIRKSLQFGAAPLSPLPVSHPEEIGPDATIVRAILPGSSAAEYLRLAVAVPSTPWQLGYLIPTDQAIASSVRETRFLALTVLLPILAFAAFLLRRRDVSAMQIAVSRIARDELERRVLERTEDLSQARDRLEAEIADHRATEAKLQGVQQDLVQANRLAILGQVAAGVAHEINQPVATIRAYAENANVFLDRRQTEPVKENLSAIAALTERIGTITEELKAFARKGRTAPEPVDLRSVIEGAVVLLRSRFAGRLDALKIELPPTGLGVVGTRIRLEQVLINLFQNALEALEGRDEAKVEVSVRETSEEVEIVVSDNGPGIPAAILDSLFTPFNTSKEKGLGLGLVISKDIVVDYGGRIDVESNDSGTRFTVHLRKATP